MSFRTEVLLSVQRALWGNVTPHMRAIAVGWEGGVVRARFLLDREPREEDLEIISDVEGYVIADFPTRTPMAFTAQYDVDKPLKHLPGEGWWAYVRHGG